MTSCSCRRSIARSWTSPSTTRPASSPWKTTGRSRPSRGRSARATSWRCAGSWRAPARSWPARTSRWSRSPPTPPRTACSSSSSPAGKPPDVPVRASCLPVGTVRDRAADPRPPVQPAPSAAAQLRRHRIRAPLATAAGPKAEAPPDRAARAALPPDRRRGAGAGAPVAGKRIIAFSDLAAHSIRLDAPPPLVPPPPNAPAGAQGIRPNVVLVDAARGSELPNAAVVATAVRPSGSLGPRGYEVVATIANSGTQPVSGLQVSLKIGPNIVAKGFVDVPAHGTAKKTLAAVLPAGVVSGRVELARVEAQGLDEDDGEDFVVHVPRDVKALIVDGAPSSLRSRDEAFFVEAALAPARTGGRIHAQTLDADAAANASLDGYDVVLLLNVAAPQKAFVEKLRQAANQRALGIFVALGDHVDPDAYNLAFGDLLPRPLHLIKTAAEPGAQGSEEHAARFGVIEWAHPLFRVFGPAEREGLESARTFRYALLKPDPSAQSHTLASYDDGAPALIETRLGQGHVLLYTSSASRTWTDWPIRVSFLPVL